CLMRVRIRVRGGFFFGDGILSEQGNSGTERISPTPGSERRLNRALERARLSIFWERLWPALATLATAIGLFLAVSWLGLWLWLPALGRAIGVGLFFLLTAAAFAPLLLLRRPTSAEGLRRLDRNTGQPHRPAST